MRRLLTTQRRVPPDHAAAYLAAWSIAEAAVVEAGGHAWLFRGAAHAQLFLEFIEWPDAAGTVLEHANVINATSQLDVFGASLESDEWEEVRVPG